MGKPEFSLFCHPTTTVYIDDNKDFLNSLTMKSATGTFKAFDDPHEGLAYVESQFKLSEDFSKGKPMSPDINTPNKLVLPQNQICQKLNTLNRFAEPSVLVVDFAMPQLNGLDLCSQISNANTKKILLTGVANERQAIHALNSELIDFYIGKSEEDLSNRLSSIVSTLNNRYFMDLMPLSSHDAYHQMPFLFDSDFADEFEQICEDLDVVEYYYVTNPGGFLLIDELGVISRLIVMTEDERSLAIDELRLKGASDDCITKLKQHNHVPFFQNHDGIFEPGYLLDWGRHIYPVRPINAQQDYVCALVEKGFTSLTSYKEYLDMPSNRLH